MRLPIAILPLLVLLLSACQSTSESTRLQLVDYEDSVSALTESLRSSELLAERGPGSEPWVWTFDRVTNLSSDVVPESEQWWLAQRVRDTLLLEGVGREKRVAMVIPEQRARGGSAGAFSARAPSHRMEMVLRSITRGDASARTDLYNLELRVLDLADGSVRWSDAFALKREAEGVAWD